jgi:hypothetical protein
LDIKAKAHKIQTENKKFFNGLKKCTPKELRQQFQTLHEEAIEHLDCLNYATC